MTAPAPGLTTAADSIRIERVDASARLDAAERRTVAGLFAACFPCCRVDEEPPAADWRWLLRLGDRIACHVCVRRQARAGRYGRFGHLAYFATAPDCRNRGFGSRLLQEVQADAPALGLQVVVLHAERNAVPLYRRAGWVEIARGAYYRCERRYSEDPVLAWSPEPKRLASLRRDVYRFASDW